MDAMTLVCMSIKQVLGGVGVGVTVTNPSPFYIASRQGLIIFVDRMILNRF